MEPNDMRDAVASIRNEMSVLRGYLKSAEHNIGEMDRQARESERVFRREVGTQFDRIEERLKDIESNMFGPNKSNGHVYYLKILWDERQRNQMIIRGVVLSVIGLILKAVWPESP